MPKNKTKKSTKQKQINKIKKKLAKTNNLKKNVKPRSFKWNSVKR